MSNIEKHEGSTLAITEDQTFFNQNQLAALQHTGVNGAGEGDLYVFFHQVQRTGLDPFAKQIYMINRQGKWTIQTGIDGFRLIARRATDRTGGTFGYEDTLWCGPDGQWTDVWLSDQPPAAAKVTVVRNGERFPAIALYREYVGKKSNGQPNMMWSTKGTHMLAKCAEALALRKAFPQDLAGLYTSDEMDQANNPVVQQQAHRQPPQPQQQAPTGQQRLAAQIPQQPTTDTSDIRADFEAAKGMENKWQAYQMVEQLFYKAQAAGDQQLTTELNAWEAENRQVAQEHRDLAQQHENHAEQSTEPGQALTPEAVQEALDAEPINQ